MREYIVEYFLYKWSNAEEIKVTAKNKYDAYIKATYEEIPKLKGVHPYSSFVEGVIMKNGKEKQFNNTNEFNPY